MRRSVFRVFMLLLISIILGLAGTAAALIFGEAVIQHGSLSATDAAGSSLDSSWSSPARLTYGTGFSDMPCGLALADDQYGYPPTTSAACSMYTSPTGRLPDTGGDPRNIPVTSR